MESMLKNLVSYVVPIIVDHLMDNKHILIDFLRDQARKTDNRIDDYVVEIISEWIEDLSAD